MAKIQVYVNDNVSEKINAIAVQRRAEGAKEKDISYSSIASMLLELGLRVYEAQLERKESGFNQMAFNKALLESVIKTQFSVNKVLGIECLSPHVKDDPRWQWKGMVQNIQEDVQEIMRRFFPEDESEGEE
ncbi:TPA: relaxosome protein TraM [Raoultella ornithinolytica]|nr:relaxosome protein TraM [Raoultella ornithinolytica]